MPKLTMHTARLVAGFTLREAAKRLNVSEKTLMNWEQGKTEPKITQFFALCALYCVPFDGISLPK